MRTEELEVAGVRVVVHSRTREATDSSGTQPEIQTEEQNAVCTSTSTNNVPTILKASAGATMTVWTSTSDLSELIAKTPCLALVRHPTMDIGHIPLLVQAYRPPTMATGRHMIQGTRGTREILTDLVPHMTRETDTLHVHHMIHAQTAALAIDVGQRMSTKQLMRPPKQRQPPRSGQLENRWLLP